MYKPVVIECTSIVERLAPRLNGIIRIQGISNILYIGMSTEQNGMPISICLPIEMQIKLLGTRETISVIS